MSDTQVITRQSQAQFVQRDASGISFVFNGENAAEARRQADLATTNGAAQVALATAQVVLGTTQADRSETEADRAAGYADDVQTARDDIAAAADLAPPRVPTNHSAMMPDVTSGNYITLPAGSIPPTSGGRDWAMVFFFKTAANYGVGTQDVLFASGTGTSNGRSIYFPHGTANPHKVLYNLTVGSFGMLPNPVNKDGLGPVFGPLEDCVGVLSQVNGVVHLAIMRLSDGAARIIKGDTLHAANTLTFTNALLPATINRASNVLTVTRTNHTRQTGNSVLIAGIGARIVTRIDANTFTVPDVGADASAVSTGFYSTQNNWNSLVAGALFTMVGGFTTTGTSSWGGGIGLLAMHHGTADTPGEFAAIVGGDGFLDADWLESLRDGSWTALPGANRYTVNLGDVGSAATGTAAGTAGNPVWFSTTQGTPGVGPTGWSEIAPIDQANWLRPARSDLGNMVHASEAGELFGTAVIPLTYTGLERGLLYRLFDAHPTSGTMLRDWTSCASPDDMLNGNVEALLHYVPINANYWARIAFPLPSGFVGATSYYVDLPVRVGPKIAVFEQSLEGDPLSAGADSGSVAMAAGYASYSGSWDNGGYPSDSTTNLYTLARSTNQRIVEPITVGAGFSNALRAGVNAALTAYAPHVDDDPSFGYVHFALNGHNRHDAATDGQVYVFDAGTAVAGVSLTGTWTTTEEQANNWTEPGTVVVNVNGAKVLVDDYAARSGASTGWDGPATAGSWNYNSGAFAITLPFGGPVTIEARAIKTSNSTSSATRLNYSAEVTGDLYSYFGLDPNEETGATGLGTGYLRDTIEAAQTFTAIMDPWLYSMLGNFSPGFNDASAAAELRNAYAIMEERWRRYPELFNRRTSELVPIVRGVVQRITSNEEYLSRARYFAEMVAEEDGIPYLPGCLSAPMATQENPHPDVLGDRQVLVQRQLALASYDLRRVGGFNDHHVIHRLIGIERLAANQLKFYFSPNTWGIGQHDAAATAFAGLWYGLTNANTYQNTDSDTYSIDSANCTMTLTKASGNFAAGYYDINRDTVIDESLSKVDQDARLLRTLCVLNGDYPAAVNRRGDDVHYSKTAGGIYVA